MLKDWNYETIRAEVIQRMMSIADEQGIACAAIEDHQAIVDQLGFTSLDVATLVSHLEKTFGVDPFAENITAATEIRTVEDVCTLYERALGGGGPSTRAGVSDALRPGNRRGG